MARARQDKHGDGDAWVTANHIHTAVRLYINHCYNYIYQKKNILRKPMAMSCALYNIHLLNNNANINMRQAF